MYLKANIKNLRNQSHCYCKLGERVHPLFLIAAAHSNDQEAADREAHSLLPTRMSILNACTRLATTLNSPIYIRVFLCKLSHVHTRRQLAVYSNLYH
jgi:hypothetical protein